MQYLRQLLMTVVVTVLQKFLFQLQNTLEFQMATHYATSTSCLHMTFLTQNNASRDNKQYEITIANEF